MQQHLLTHAIKNVWCTPDQDKQLILDLKRITSVGGVKGTFTLHWRQYNLPTPKDRFHIYPIGQHSTANFNLPNKQLVWHRLTDLVLERNLLVDVYTAGGLMYQRGLVWVMITHNNNIVFAIQAQPRISDLTTGKVYMRLRSNSYFDNPRSSNLDVKIRSESLQVEIKNEQIALQGRYHRDQERLGHAYMFHNGKIVTDVLPNQVSLGDHIEYIYDSSITEVVHWKLSDLESYKSSLDANRKYLLHLPRSLARIDYKDDVDFWMYTKDEYGRMSGVYIHQNHPSICRMVTHRDYGLSTLAVDYYIDSQSEWTYDDVYIMAFVHESGYNRPLVNEQSRIKELYRMSDVDIIDALLGINSLVPEWKAAELESSSYTRLMSAPYSSFTAMEVLNAYGYNATSKIAVHGLVPVLTNNVELPVGLSSNSTILEYDKDGVLLGYGINTTSPIYVTQYPETSFIEGYPGIGGTDLVYRPSYHGDVLSSKYGYRFYTAKSRNGIPYEPWVDVTGDFTKYEVRDGRISWFTDPTSILTAYNSTDSFFLKEYVLDDQVEFIYEIDLMSETAFQGSEGQDLGQILIWLNGRSLQADLDYKEIDGYILINNIQYMVPEGPQRILIMCLDRPAPLVSDRGFAIHNKLSVNSVYDVRDDKVVRCVVDGRVRDIATMAVDERESNVLNRIPVNGKPYSIRAVPVPIHDLVPYEAYPRKLKAMEIDARVSQFLTNRLPDTIDEELPTIDHRYPIFSPVVAKLLSDFKLGLVELPDLSTGDNTIRLFMDRYKYLLPFDPCVYGVDNRYVYIAPTRYSTRIEVTQKEYELIQRIVELYLNDLVTVSFGVVLKVKSEV